MLEPRLAGFFQRILYRPKNELVVSGLRLLDSNHECIDQYLNRNPSMEKKDASGHAHIVQKLSSYIKVTLWGILKKHKSGLRWINNWKRIPVSIASSAHTGNIDKNEIDFNQPK
jgi:hypothetical protein